MSRIIDEVKVIIFRQGDKEDQIRFRRMKKEDQITILQKEVKKCFWSHKCREYKREAEAFAKKEDNVSLSSIADRLVEKYGADKIKIYNNSSGKIEEIKIFPGSRTGENVFYISIEMARYHYGYINIHISHKLGGSSLPSHEADYFVSKFMDEYAANKAALGTELAPLNAELLEIEKEKKIKDIARQSIRSAVAAKMTETGHKWNLREEEDRYVLRIKMKYKKMIEITLGYKDFIDKVPEMLEAIKQAENLLATISYPVDIKGYGNNIEWNE